MVEAQKKSYETYKKVATLGVGSFGTAYQVECQSDKSMAVIKQIDIASMSEEERRETLREAKILEVLNHPNIVRFREVYKTKKGKLCIVMDYADGGDLQTKIKDRYKNRNAQGKLQYMAEDEVLNWFTQICLAMKHVHDKKILHRDLKSQNIFITKKGMVKLGDFGIARVLSNTRSKAKTVVGTPYYLSPEIIKSESYNFKSDVWSLGVLLYEIAALQPPFNAQSLHQLAQRIISGKYSPLPSTYSPQLNQLIGMMLQRDPAARPTIHQILKVPIIEKRITRFLQADLFKEEFAHTLLHNQNVFDEFRKIQNKQKEDVTKAAERARKIEEHKRELEEKERQQRELEKAQRKMDAMSLQQENLPYQPPQSYIDKYQDPEFFNYQYQKYVEHLSKQNEEETSYAQPALSSNPSSTTEDRDDQEAYSQQDSGVGSVAPSVGGTGLGGVSNEEMINITSCDEAEFQSYMCRQYGTAAFTSGYQIVKANSAMIYSDDGEDRLMELLQGIFADDDSCKGFINFCTTYIIVQNMNFQ